METLAISQYEIERGKPMPGKLHARLQTKILVQLENNFQDKYDTFSELSLDLAGWESVPDIALYPKSEMDFLHDKVQMKEPPLCALEILPPIQSLQELITKAEKYFRHGVKSCWLVLPGLKSIYVFKQATEYKDFQANEQLTDELLDISIPLTEVFK
jgi:Uma2 family endonuclease